MEMPTEECKARCRALVPQAYRGQSSSLSVLPTSWTDCMRQYPMRKSSVRLAGRCNRFGLALWLEPPFRRKSAAHRLLPVLVLNSESVPAPARAPPHEPAELLILPHA